MKIGQQGKSFFMGDSVYWYKDAKIREQTAMNKGLYQKQAMRGIAGVYDSEKRMDKSLGQIRDRLRALQEDSDKADACLQEINRKMAQAKVDYNVEDGSQEDQDLDVLKKEYDINHLRIQGELTEEEEQRLKKIKPTDYQKYSMELYAQADYWKETLDANRKERYVANYVIRKTNQKRLEKDPMVDAQKAKEQLMEAAAKEAAAMLKEEALSTLEERAEELQEASEARKENREEKEAQLQAAKQKKEEAEVSAEKVRKDAAETAQSDVPNDTAAREIEAQIKKVLEEQKLLEEELKGLRVNAGV